ncbi:MAG: hypothetical protein Q8R33_09600 [Burkholderiales bacterium]|nr:hypothetical protein [Burkholderiales bacterium]
MEVTILSIETAPGDVPRGMEQPNGDLLLPANARPLVAQALLQAELALTSDEPVDLPALKEAIRLLNIERPEPKCSWLGNLYRVREL